MIKRLKREDIAAHEQDDKLHLHMAIDAINSQQTIDDSLKAEINSLKAEVNSLKEVSLLKSKQSLTFVVSDIQEKKENDERFTSPLFYTSPNGYHMEFRVYANGYRDGEGTHVSVFVHILKGKYDAGLKWPFVGEVTLTLLNHLEDRNHYTMTLKYTAGNDSGTVGKRRGYPYFIAHSELAGGSAKYLKDDALYFRVSAEVDDHKPWLECQK